MSVCSSNTIKEVKFWLSEPSQINFYSLSCVRARVCVDERLGVRACVRACGVCV